MSVPVRAHTVLFRFNRFGYHGFLLTLRDVMMFQELTKCRVLNLSSRPSELHVSGVIFRDYLGGSRAEAVMAMHFPDKIHRVNPIG